MKPRVLVVDDDLLVRSALLRTLRDHFEVDLAASGADAMEILKSVRYAAIVSDLKMPGVDGLRLLQWVATYLPETQRILLTGHAEFPSTVGSMNDAGIYKIVLKPWDNEELIAVLTAAIGREKA